MLLLAAVNWHSFFFFLFAAIACLFALGVLFSSNIVRMAFYLIISLGATAGLFFLAGAEFVGAMQLMIYVGGTLVLLVFGVMLTAQEAFVTMKTRGGEWVLGAIVGGALLLLLVRTCFSVDSWRASAAHMNEVSIAESKTSSQIGNALIGVRADSLDQPREELVGGMSGYLLPFEIVSVHLLVVLIGAAYLARTKRRAPGREYAIQPAAVRDSRRMNLFISVGLIKGMVINGLLAILFLVFKPQLAEWVKPILPDLPPWVFTAIGLLFVLSALLFAVVWKWQRWGLYLLPLIPFAQAGAIVAGGGDPLVAGLFLAILILPIAILIALICRIGNPTVWSQMD